MHDALSPGTLVHARYQIVHIIGKGGMGAVYEALDQRLNATVALKQTTVRGRKHTDAAFAHEAQLLARLHHQGLPKVMDYFTDPLGQFLVMEYFAGDDLNVLLTRHPGPFAVDEVLDWADQILHTLIYLHRQQPPVIHRDIKPQNLKLTDDGQVMLLDFGLAKGLPQQSSFFGFTPQYAPLEQIEGSGTEPRSDLYALAATLYHLLTNTRPAGAMSRLSAMHNHAADPLPPVHTLNPQVPQAVSAVLQQALAIKITDRPASATAMRAALQAARHTASAKPTVVLAPPPPMSSQPCPSQLLHSAAGCCSRRVRLLPRCISKRLRRAPKIRWRSAIAPACCKRCANSGWKACWNNRCTARLCWNWGWNIARMKWSILPMVQCS
jgi:serine/threonine protein kinase